MTRGEFDPVKNYYDSIANEYDQSRFANSYGQYIHEQERTVLAKHADKIDRQNCLDLACGTGRFLDLASAGADISEEMLRIARAKHPDKELIQASATQLSFQDRSFSSVISFHLLMHLEKTEIALVLKEVHRVTKPGGFFIFDIPSSSRRKLLRHKREGWHGSTAMNKNEVQSMCADQWEIQAVEGICLLPIHRINSRSRQKWIEFDTFLSATFLKSWCSYNIYVLKKL